MGNELNADFPALLEPGPDRTRLAEVVRAALAEQAESRTALARYLHDTLLQSLVVLSFTNAAATSAGPDQASSDLIGECCRQARIIGSLLSVEFTGQSDVAGTIEVVIENLREDAGIQVHFEVDAEFPEELPADLCGLIFGIAMEFLTAVVVSRCHSSHILRLGQQSGWVNLDVPARWGMKFRNHSFLSHIRIETLGGIIEEYGPKFTRIRLPISPDESSNSDRR